MVSRLARSKLIDVARVAVPPPLKDFWKWLPHRTPTPLICKKESRDTYALCFARSMTSF
jgi:hypothetical protein